MTPKPICPRAAALNRAMRQDAREKAALAIAGTPGGAAEAREFRSVAADRAGEVYLSAADGNIAHLREAQLLTPRQCDAAAHLARLWGLGLRRRPYSTGDGGNARDEDAITKARREYDALVDAAPYCTRAALDVLAMGEWIVTRDPLPLWREGLNAVAQRLYGREREDC